MLKVKNNGNLIIISGPSGAGKGTICKELIRRNENIIPSISFTSRSIANGEKEGVDYFYISKQEFENKIKEGFFLEYAIVHNNDYYGTPKDKVLEYLNKGYNVILEIDIEGALKVKEIMKDVLCIFILPPSAKVQITCSGFNISISVSQSMSPATTSPSLSALNLKIKL